MSYSQRIILYDFPLSTIMTEPPVCLPNTKTWLLVIICFHLSFYFIIINKLFFLFYVLLFSIPKYSYSIVTRGLRTEYTDHVDSQSFP